MPYILTSKSQNLIAQKWLIKGLFCKKAKGEDDSILTIVTT